MGLHQRYAQFLGSFEPEAQTLLSKEREDEIRRQLTVAFDDMMRVLYKQQGAQLSVEIMATPKVQEFVQTHASALDSSFQQVPMSENMRQRLQRSDYIFSGLKAFHELNEAFPSLLDENGNRKPFEQFLNDVWQIDSAYNANYLRAEYNFAHSSASMAAKWEEFAEDGDRYNLQYRTAKDNKVRPEHAALDGVTLPFSDPFWETYYPPNGWNCRCSVVQVRKSKYPTTPRDEAMARGEEALQRDTKGIFHFNPGKQQKAFPDYNPYTIRRCNDCDVAKGDIKLARAFVPQNELCAACQLIRALHSDAYIIDKTFGERLRISTKADQTELDDNRRAAESILNAFPDTNISIRTHVIQNNVKNPEYTINGRIADRKGIQSEKGVTSAFVKAKTQGCEAIVIDLDKHMLDRKIKFNELAKRIDWRRDDFASEAITQCYVVYQGHAVLITKQHNTRESILEELKKLRP